MPPKKGASGSTLLDRIMVAIRAQPATPNGVSRVAITKYLKTELALDVPASKLKQAFKKAVESGKLIQTGQSFRVPGDVVPEAPPEPQVQMQDVKEGEGDEAVSGSTVIVKYEGKLKDGTVFDAASSFDFVLGAGDVIKGWDIGVAGMKVGGVRKLEVPAKLGYGKRGAPPEIPPNADLFFIVTLKKVIS